MRSKEFLKEDNGDLVNIINGRIKVRGSSQMLSVGDWAEIRDTGFQEKITGISRGKVRLENGKFYALSQLRYPITNEAKSYQAPEIEAGDEVKVGKFKNRKATVKSITKDKDNQPVLKTDKGEHKLFKPKISKLEDEK